MWQMFFKGEDWQETFWKREGELENVWNFINALWRNINDA